MYIDTRILHGRDGHQGDDMLRNEAKRLPLEDQASEMHMEARIARLESDVETIKVGVNELRQGMAAANDAIAGLRVDVGKLTAMVPTLASQADVKPLAAIVPTLATKADFNELQAVIPTLATKAEVAVIPHLATKADLHELKAALESKMLRWFVGAVLAVASLAFSIARFVH